MQIISENIANAWEKSIVAILQNGEWIPAERGNRAKELRNVLFSISNPENTPQVSDKYYFSSEFIKEYSDNYLLGDKSIGSVAERISKLGENKLNQLDCIIGLLNENSYTRRALVSTWNPQIDLYSNHPPCLSTLHFQIRNQKLEITGVLRSNDAWFAALPDLIAIYKVQDKVAKSIGVSIGNLNLLSISYHIYEMDYLKAFENFQIKNNAIDIH